MHQLPLSKKNSIPFSILLTHLYKIWTGTKGRTEMFEGGSRHKTKPPRFVTVGKLQRHGEVF